MQGNALKYRRFILSLSVALVGAAVFAASPSSCAAPAYRPAAQVVSHTYRIPGGVLRVESITWGAPAASVAQVVRLSPAQARALEASTLQQVRDMQAQIQWMQSLMSAAFAQPAFPLALSSVPVEWTVPQLAVVPVPVDPQPQAGRHSVAPVPAANVPGHPMVHCRWSALQPAHRDSGRTAI
ncbi:MAG: hypothetical protein ACP5GA_08100 [Acidithiobacillus sp.]